MAMAACGLSWRLRFVLCVLVMCCWEGLDVHGQMMSPFEGQAAIPPPATADGRVPVYLSASLEKLLYVDDTKYQFEVIFNAVLSWRDSRAAAILNGSSVAVATSQQNQQDNLNNVCLSPSNAGNNSDGCKTATVDPYQAKTCNRLCQPGDSLVCCDALWMPSVDIENNIYQSQDRLALSKIGLAGDGVAWVVRVHGVFSSPMAFKRFPFDRQNLQLRFVTRNPGSVVLLPSLLQKNGGGKTSGGNRADELPNWDVDDISWLNGDAEIGPDVEIYSAASGSDPVLTAHASQDIFNTLFSDPEVIIIRISRQSSFYFWNMVFPVLICVTLSWVAFFVDPTDLEVRLGTAITLLLTITALQFLVNDSLPAASYLTAFHTTLLVSYLFISFVVLENLLVYYMTRLKDANERKARRPSVAATEGPLAAQEAALGAQSSSEVPFEVQGANGSSSGKGEKGQDSSMRFKFHLWRAGKIPFLKVIMRDHQRWAEDQAHAFRKAAFTDRVCIVLFPLTYYLTVILVFATAGRYDTK